MAKKQNMRAVMRKQLGKQVADAMLDRVDKMVKQGKSATAIQNAFAADLTAHIEKQVISAVVTNIGPITPLTVKPISSSVKSTIAPSVGVSVKSSIAPSVKPIAPSVKPAVAPSIGISPGLMVKGSK